MKETLARLATGLHDFPLFGRVSACFRDDRVVSYLLETDHPEFPVVVAGNERGLSPHSIVIEDETTWECGDIVEIYADGRIAVVYEATGNDGALFVTDRCNSNCIMCPQPPGRDNYFNDSSRIVKLLDGNPEYLGITGGEPTLFFDDLLGLVREIREKFPDVFLQLLTNARVLKDTKKAKQLVAEVGENGMYCIPLYSDDEIIHDELVGARSYWQTVEGIYNLGLYGARIELRTVVQKRNIQRLPAYSDFVYRTFPFISCVAFMGIEPVGNALSNFEKVWVDPAADMNTLENAVTSLYKRGMDAYVFNYPLCILPRSLWEMAARSISGWKTSYAPVCDACQMRNKCGGCFSSSLPYLETALCPIALDDAAC